MPETPGFVGKSIRIQYASGQQIEARYDSATRLTWRALSGPSEGQTGTETIHAAEIVPSVFFVSWVEREHGFTVSNVVDFEHRRIAAFVTWEEGTERQALLDSGTFEVIG